MHTHSRSCLEGPVSVTRDWWRDVAVTENPLTSNEREPMFRAALVDQIRREIAAGTYDTPEKMDLALDKLLRRLDGEDA